jgi:hypothetical protein
MPYVAIISTCNSASIHNTCPVAFQRLPAPRERPTPPLVQAISYPSNHLHLHFDIVSQRPSAPTGRPPTSHFVPQQLFCHGPAPNDHLEGVSDIRHLRPSHIAIQQLSIPASHTLYRRSSALSSIPDCVSSAALSRWFALTIPYHLPPTAHIPVRPSACLHTCLPPHWLSGLSSSTCTPTLPFLASSLWFSSKLAHPIPSFRQLSLPHHLVHLV